jgi:hypothetical protein
MRKRARANPGRKHQTFDAIVQTYERAPLEFLKQILPERFLVFPSKSRSVHFAPGTWAKRNTPVLQIVLSCSNGTARHTDSFPSRNIDESTTSPKTSCAPLWLGSGKHTKRTTLTGSLPPREVCHSKVITQHFTRCECVLALPPFADKGFTPAPPPVRSSEVLRFVGGKGRRTQIGVALSRDGKECI